MLTHTLSVIDMLISEIQEKTKTNEFLFFILAVMLCIFLYSIFWSIKQSDADIIVFAVVSTVIAVILSFMIAMTGYQGEGNGDSIVSNGKMLVLLSFTSWLLGWYIWNGPQFFILPIFLFVGTEIFFWLDEEKPKDYESKMWFTFHKKIDGLIDTIFICSPIIYLTFVYDHVSALRDYIVFWLPGVVFALFVVGAVVLACFLSYGYIWLNARRYK